jgi:class 3 adenylate cyclase
VFFGVQHFLIAHDALWLGYVNLANAVVLLCSSRSCTGSEICYTGLDGLVDRHGLEKTKTSGDSYMVISGVPQSRTDHLQDPQGREVPLRIGLAAGPVVAGVVGARKFFHDVWGDVVNVASRMEARTSSKNAAR